MILKLFVLITMTMSIIINISQITTVNAQEITNVPTVEPTLVPTQIIVLPPNNAIPSNVTDSINEAIVAFSDLQILITTLSSAGGILILFIVVYLFIKFNGRKYIYLPSLNSKPKTEQVEQTKESSSKNITNIDIL